MSEKSQSATPRRREEARKQGNVWAPRELGPAAALGVAALGAGTAGPLLWAGMRGLLADMLARGDAPVTLAEAAALVPWGVPAGLAVAVALVGGGLSMAASRHVTLGNLEPKLARISPVAGLQRIFSVGGLAGAGTALLKLASVAAVALAVLLPLLPRLAHAGGDGAGGDGLAVIGGGMVRLLLASALVLVVIALVDGVISFRLRETKLMMSLEEVKRESRQNDGAPEVKAAIRRAQLAAATRRLRTSLADASVVVVNPVHFAVAMRYQPGSDAAPVVVEKGRLEMAAAIIAVARELNIPVIRTPRLARALFFTARIGAPVREELFGAVATILAFVMSFDAPEAAAPPPVFLPPAFDFDESGARRRPGGA